MATEQASSVPTEPASLGRWSSWLAAIVGLWVLATPFVLSGPVTNGPAMWSNVIAGGLVLMLSAGGAYGHRTTSVTNVIAQWSGWIAALVGAWIVVSPFVLRGSITAGNPMYSNVVAGIVAAVLAAYAAYSLA